MHEVVVSNLRTKHCQSRSFL